MLLMPFQGIIFVYNYPNLIYNTSIYILLIISKKNRKFISFILRFIFIIIFIK